MLRTTSKVLVCCVAFGGCGKNSRTPGRFEGPASTATASATAHRESGRSPACDEPATGRQLQSFLGVEVPGTYWIDMTFEQREWRPAHTLLMPSHHATRLELINLAEFSELTELGGALPLRFTIELTEREIQRVGERVEWRATYFARIVAVCSSRN